jgi:epoxyqueuosine reductase QueG
MHSQPIKDFARSLHLDACGIAPIQLDGHVGTNAICPLASGQGRERFEPERLLPGCQSIIVVLFPYYIPDDQDSNLSMYCRCTDYHLIVPSYLDRIAAFLQNTYPGCSSRCVVDTSPLSDRWLAYKAGLGFFGDNGCFINKKYGSYCFIGSILTTIPFEPDEPVTDQCLHCSACAAACPGHCLENGTYSYEYCKSYLTQKKVDLTPQEIAVIKKTALVFGCDECQRVCPHNNDITTTPLPEFRQNRLTRIIPDDIEPLTNKEFRQTYGNRAFSWRGKKILLRNMSYTTAIKDT